jgi:hypothetical protein
MVRKRCGRRKVAKRARGRARAVDVCCCCSIFSWEKKKFDKFHELYFGGCLNDSAFEQHVLDPPLCNGGVVCCRCGTYVCHPCVQALHCAIMKDHPNLEHPWLESTRKSTIGDILRVSVGHCCMMEEEKTLINSLNPSVAASLAGATHYFQYDLSIGSTPPNCVDVFSLGAAGSNPPVTHAVFPISLAVDLANEGHVFVDIDLTGPIVQSACTSLSSLSKNFNKEVYSIKIVAFDFTRADAPSLGKPNMSCFGSNRSICNLTLRLHYSRFSPYSC